MATGNCCAPHGSSWTSGCACDCPSPQAPGFTEHCGLGPARFVEFEIDRDLGRPGQALTYKLGEKVWLEAPEAARRRDGSSFSIKRFHHHALNLEPMGLDLLRAELTYPAAPADQAGTGRTRARSAPRGEKASDRMITAIGHSD
ncbi:DUF885 family protein [Streptomyces sp. 130]|uniref:DUF885 family protein n=1 Tax=Streptomyces sp. 130 TaxID=2591006 RepID=UPI0037D9B9CA